MHYCHAHTSKCRDIFLWQEGHFNNKNKFCEASLRVLLWKLKNDAKFNTTGSRGWIVHPISKLKCPHLFLNPHGKKRQQVLEVPEISLAISPSVSRTKTSCFCVGRTICDARQGRIQDLDKRPPPTRSWGYCLVSSIQHVWCDWWRLSRWCIAQCLLRSNTFWANLNKPRLLRVSVCKHERRHTSLETHIGWFTLSENVRLFGGGLRGLAINCSEEGDVGNMLFASYGPVEASSGWCLECFVGLHILYCHPRFTLGWTAQNAKGQKYRNQKSWKMFALTCGWRCKDIDILPQRTQGC